MNTTTQHSRFNFCGLLSPVSPFYDCFKNGIVPVQSAFPTYLNAPDGSLLPVYFINIEQCDEQTKNLLFEKAAEINQRTKEEILEFVANTKTLPVPFAHVGIILPLN